MKVISHDSLDLYTALYSPCCASAVSTGHTLDHPACVVPLIGREGSRDLDTGLLLVPVPLASATPPCSPGAPPPASPVHKIWQYNYFKFQIDKFLSARNRSSRCYIQISESKLCKTISCKFNVPMTIGSFRSAS